MLPPLLLLANCSCKKWARTQITLGAMCLATPTHIRTHIVCHQSGRYSRNFVHSLPFPTLLLLPSRPIPACKLIHLRVVAGLQRDLVIVSPLFPPSPSPATTILHVQTPYPIIVVAFVGPPPTGSGPAAAAAAGSQQSFRVFAQLGLICKVMRRVRRATVRLSLVNRTRSSTYCRSYTFPAM